MAAEALKAYQLKADGDAEALLAAAKPSERRRALGEVAARFFLSSIGDDSAYELACLMLDDLEYFGAARMLRKLLEHHPSLSVSRTEILKRLAVAEHELSVIRISKEQELTRVEQKMLPDTLRKATREDLLEQIDPWISLADQLEFWIDQFDPDKFED